METKIAKWGNSLAVRIPADIAARIRLQCGDRVELSVREGRIWLVPERGVPTLDEMLASVTEGDTHGEIDWGPALGEEVW